MTCLRDADRAFSVRGEALQDAIHDANFHGIEEPVRSIERDDRATAAIDGWKGPKIVRPAPKKFLPNSSQLAKKPHGTVRQPMQKRIQVAGGGTYSTWIRTTSPLLMRWTTS
jgi:hypothetical protein